MEIGELITRYRKENKLTTMGFAALLGVSRQFLGQVEAGKKGVGVSLLKKLVEVTGLGYEHWLDDEEYIKNREHCEKLNDFLDMLVDSGLIKSEEDILKDAFKDVLTAALLADVKHKLELKESKEKTKKN